MAQIDAEMARLVGQYGLDETLAALSRFVAGMEQTRTTRTLFGYLNRTYEWFLTKTPQQD